MGHEVRHNKLKQHLHQHHHHKHGARRLPAGPNTISRSDPQQQQQQQLGPPPLGYPPLNIDYAPGSAAVAPYSYNYNPALVQQQEQQLQQALADVKRHTRNERLGEVGAAAAGAFALYELHEAKVDPEHARRHKLEAKLAGAVAVGSANYAYHEHLEKKKSEHLVDVLSGGHGSCVLPLTKSEEKEMMKKKKEKKAASLLTNAAAVAGGAGHKQRLKHQPGIQTADLLQIVDPMLSHKSKHRLW